jgi:DNA anti-recombination protein RmuC
VTTTVESQNTGTPPRTPEAEGGAANLEKVRDLLFGVQNDRVKTEQEDRSSAAKDLARQLDDTARAFEKKTGQLDDQMARGLRDVRQQLHDQHQQLSDDLKRQADQILERLSRESDQLKSDKTDRASLAALLTEMAMRLTDDFRLPTPEDATRG